MSESGESERLRAVVDTNLFISGIISRGGAPDRLIQLFRAGAFLLLFAEVQRAELKDVLNRPSIKEKYGLADDEVTDLLFAIDTRAARVPLASRLPVAVRDPKDEKILAIALGGKADFLVTGDEDLLVLNGNPKLGRLQIVPVAVFLNLLASPES